MAHFAVAGYPAPMFALPDASGRVWTLRDLTELLQHRQQIEESGYRVVLITFANAQRVEKWWSKFDVGSQDRFLVLFDEGRGLYASYGMGRSVVNTWSPGTLLWYAKKIFTGEYSYRAHEEDPHQLGGDFVVGSNLYIVLAHPSRTPIDRVPVVRILEAVQASASENDEDHEAAPFCDPSSVNHGGRHASALTSADDRGQGNHVECSE
ncbi:hypothetical protein FVE85_7454 [Porphyridium purpureum]|uniref:Uncharacterized protein n=1 Tax=Porphyridium purpureum TaxID=35688 RepID=A0A5J4Z771_PORPP|nr:hypothetical protein FVE85_7454 [Porphyridium purpureum]|eukprot:POR5877..scf295_1